MEYSLYEYIEKVLIYSEPDVTETVGKNEKVYFLVGFSYTGCPMKSV